MVERGYVATKQEAFETWIGDGLPAFVPHVKPSIASAVKAVKLAGGFTSLAHPLYYGVPSADLLAVLFQLGVDAVEAVHRSHTDAYRYELTAEANSVGLGITVGSDFHGLSWQSRPVTCPFPSRLWLLTSTPSEPVPHHRRLKEENDGQRNEEQRKRVRRRHERTEDKRTKPNDPPRGRELLVGGHAGGEAPAW